MLVIQKGNVCLSYKKGMNTCHTKRNGCLSDCYKSFVMCSALGVVAEWSKVLTAVPWPFMVCLGHISAQVHILFHVIFSFVHFISLYTLGGLHAFRKPLPYNIYLFNLRIANHILIKCKIFNIRDIATTI